MSLKNIASETLSYLEKGGFRTEDGRWVDFAQAQRAAESGSFVLTPEAGAALLEQVGPGGPAPSILVTAERTQEAARRLVEDEGWSDLVVLNFASARNPGGGFIRGAKAQEEDVARASGVYPCLLGQSTYYDVNRAQRSLIYTDHLIYSPGVPWFRTRSRTLLDRYFQAAIITAPAPNAGEVLRRDPGAGPRIDVALRHRAGLVLALARAQGHRSLLLGGWGCGVFRNDPARVADAFGSWLASETFAGDFDRVCFAIFDRGGLVLKAFEDRFA
ncbi:MAG: TIGR02452 family protein [Myxococcota bacterium]